MSLEELKKHIEVSKYSVTLREWNYIKKRITYIAKTFSEKLDVKFYKDGSYCSISLLVPVDFVSLIDSFNRKSSHNSGLIFTDSIHSLRSKINEELRYHDVCYSERDIQSDYFGSYRFNHQCSVERHPDSKEKLSKLEKLIEELVYEQKLNNVSLKNFLNLCEKYELSESLINKLWEEDFTQE